MTDTLTIEHQLELLGPNPAFAIGSLDPAVRENFLTTFHRRPDLWDPAKPR